MFARGRVSEYPRDNRTAILHVLLILLVVSVSYFNALDNGFVTDDFGLAVDNPNVKSWDRLGRIFTTGYWDAEGGTGGLYRPLAILSFFIEFAVSRLNPVMCHLDNIILHLLCSVLVYFLLKEIFDASAAPLAAALLFAAHPVHTEAVTWVSGRAELMGAMFGLASMLAYIRYRDEKFGMPLSLGLYLLSLLSKESGIVVPPMLAAYMLLYEPARDGESRVVQLARRLWPYIAIAAVFIPIRFAVLGQFGPKATEQALYGMGLYDRFLIMCRVLFEYVRLGFIPAELKAAYLFPPPGSILDVRVIAALGLLFGMALLARRIIGFSRVTYLAISWFLLALAPVSNIIPTGVVMSERAMYIPSIGACMIMGAAAAAAGRYISGRTGKSLPYGLAVLLPVLGLFMAGTIARNPVWKNQDVFGRDYVKMVREYIREYPDDDKLYRHLAAMQLRFFVDEPETEQAIQEAYKRIGDGDEEMRYLMAFSYMNRSMPEKALEEIMYVINNCASSGSDYFLAAGILTRMERYGEALEMVDEAIALNPNKVEFYMLKGDLMMETGQDDAAIKVYEHVTRIHPNNYDAFLRLGILYDSHGRFGQAVQSVRRAVELRPDIPDLHYFLAVAYLDAGMKGPAAEEIDKAIALKPGYREALELRETLR